MKKKWLWSIFTIMLVILIMLGGLLFYIAPSKELTMDAAPFRLQDKLVEMVRNLTPEMVLTETEINALIKSNMNRNLSDKAEILGAHFNVEQNQLHGDINVKLMDTIKAQLQVTYHIVWEEPQLKLVPASLSVKDIPLPLTLLEEISFPIYDESNAMISIEQIFTRNEQLVIELGLNLFQ